jgi:hypothetical protein
LFGRLNNIDLKAINLVHELPKTGLTCTKPGKWAEQQQQHKLTYSGYGFFFMLSSLRSIPVNGSIGSSTLQVWQLTKTITQNNAFIEKNKKNKIKLR